MSRKIKLVLGGAVTLVFLLALLTNIFQRRLADRTKEPSKPVFVLDQTQDLSIVSMSPTNNEEGVGVDSQIIATFSRPLSETEQKNLSFNISPQTEGVVSFFDDAKLIKFAPRFPLRTNTSYTSRITYIGTSFVWSFTTSSSEKLSRADILKMYPWYERLPIKSDKYIVYFDLNDKKFKGSIYSTVEGADTIRKEIFELLENSGVEIGKYPFELDVKPPTSSPSSDQRKQEEFNKIVERAVDQFSPDQQTALITFRAKLPHQSSSFDMKFSPKLNHYFVSIKSPTGYDDLKQFLGDNNVLDIYLDGYGVIITGTEPVDEIERRSERAMLDAIEEATHENSHVQGVTTVSVNQGSVQGATAGPPNKIHSFFEAIFKRLGGSSSGGSGGGTTPNLAPLGNLNYPPNLVQNSAGYYKMPDAPNGEYRFNGGTCEAQRYGQRELVAAIHTVAMAWYPRHQDSPLVIGDLNATLNEHSSHTMGRDADITDEKGYATFIPWDEFNREYAVELGRLFIDTKLISLIGFDDEPVARAVNAYAAEKNLPGQMQVWGGHEDHFHIRLNLPDGPPSTPEC